MIRSKMPDELLLELASAMAESARGVERVARHIGRVREENDRLAGALNVALGALRDLEEAEISREVVHAAQCQTCATRATTVALERAGTAIERGVGPALIVHQGSVRPAPCPRGDRS